MNVVALSGRVTKDPELFCSQTGTDFTFFSIAVKHAYWEDDNAESEKSNVDFIPVIAFGKLARACVDNLYKGRQVNVQGKLKYKKHNNAWMMSCVVVQIEFVGRNERKSNPNPPTSTLGEVCGDYEIPF